MDPTTLVEKITDFARGHRVLSREEQDEAHRLAEGLSQFLEGQCTAMVKDSGDRPLLFWYSNDGTPVLCRKSTHQALGSHQIIRRAGI
eukprot:4294533-Lingulodinium_polyedra.AAC.1